MTADDRVQLNVSVNVDQLVDGITRAHVETVHPGRPCVLDVDGDCVYRAPGARRTLAEIYDLASYDEGLCGDCITGRCHWGGAMSRESEAAVAAGRPFRERCGCARHRISVAARRQCGDLAPQDLFPFIAVCRRTKAHKSLEHRDLWREVSWEGAAR
jgi:hypothetical protein